MNYPYPLKITVVKEVLEAKAPSPTVPIDLT
jgi:hypothetical protein